MLLKHHAPAEVRALLRGVPLFMDMTDRELDTIAAVARPVEFAPGAVICAEGTSGIGLHIIVEGTVLVSSSHSTDRTLGPGAYFGEIAVVDGGPRMATVTATTAVRTLSIVAWEFTGILDQHPQVVRRLVKELCVRLRKEAATISA
jgi:CRP-like cAMP-binding protein